MQHPVTAAFLNQKGGVGKTTTVANVGAGLSLLGNRVLLVDLDPQGHLTRFLGIDHRTVRHTIYDVLRGDIHPSEAVARRPLKARRHVEDRVEDMGMALIPAGLNFANADLDFAGSSDRDHMLKRALATLRGRYDYILLDCPPSLGLVSSNALAAATTVFIPVQTEYLALESLEDLLAWVEAARTRLNTDFELGGMIATRFDGRKVLSRTVVESLRERYGALLMDTIIRDNIALAESPRFGKDIFSHRSRSFGADDYLALCNEIMDRMTQPADDTSIDLDELESFVSEPFRFRDRDLDL